MCGIVGFCVKKRIAQFTEELHGAVQSLVHRGPDDQKIWTDRGIGLGHTRLSILELSASGSQPMTSLNGRYVIVYNGEIYNYVELGQQLPGGFEKHSDTRVLIEAIAYWGFEAAVQKLNGMFAFAVWDKEDQALYLVRDSIGIKPLYWAKVPEGIIFGSELKAFKYFSSQSWAVDVSSLYQYFSHQYVTAPGTVYQDCFKLLPGQILKINQEGLITQQFFAPHTGQYLQIRNVNEAREVLSTLLDNSVKRHLRSDVPIAAFLSGGIDSSLLVSWMAQRGPLKTYSIGYREQDFDESARAQKIAHYLGVEHETFILGPDDIRQCLEKIPYWYDEPFADASCIPTHLISAQVAQHVKVAFSGDGADELFGGYPRYFSAQSTWNSIGYLPYSIRKILSALIPEKNLGILKWLARCVLRNPGQSLPYLKSILKHPNVGSFFHFDNYLGLPPEAFLEQAPMKVAHHFFDQLDWSSEKGISALLRYDQQWRLPDGMLTKVDRASMAASLEVRVPFLDNEIVAFARQVPWAWGTHAQNTKPLLRQLLAQHIPENLFNAPKTGFHVPLKRWLRSHYRSWAENILETGSSGQEEILNLEEVKKMWNRYCSGDERVFYPVWSALIYLQWKQCMAK